MENLKRYDFLLEDLGSESNNFEKIMRKMGELKGSQLEEKIDSPEDIEKIETIENEPESSEAEKEEEPTPKFEDDDFKHLNVKEIEDTEAEEQAITKPSYQYIPDKADEIVDQIFKNIDTPEYLEKREKGGFQPQFGFEEGGIDEKTDEEEEEDIDTDELELLYGQPKELQSLNMDLMQDDTYNKDISQLDDLLSEIKKEIPDLESHFDEEEVIDETELENLPIEEGETITAMDEPEIPLSDEIPEEFLTPTDETALTEEEKLEVPIEEEITPIEEEITPISEEETTLTGSELDDLLSGSKIEEEIPDLKAEEEAFAIDEGANNLEETIPIEEEITPIEEETTLTGSELNDLLSGSKIEEEIPDLKAEEEVPELKTEEESFSLDEGLPILEEETIPIKSEEETPLLETELDELITGTKIEEETIPEIKAEEETFSIDEGIPTMEEEITPVEEVTPIEEKTSEIEYTDLMTDTKVKEPIEEELISEEIPDEITEDKISEEKISLDEQVTLDEIPDIEGQEENLKEDLSGKTKKDKVLSEEIIETKVDKKEEPAYESWQEELEAIELEEGQKLPDEFEEETKAQKIKQKKIEIPEDIEKFSEEDLTEENIKIIQDNLGKLPVNLALHLRNLLLNSETPNQIKSLITNELLKDYPNLYRLKAVSGYDESTETKEKGGFLPFLKIISVFLILAVIGSSLYFFVIKPYFDNKDLLESGLKNIDELNFILAEEKFKNAKPNIDWYNKYALKYLDKNAYKYAEQKLIGERDPALNMIKPGAVDIKPDDVQTRLNLAEVYLAQNKFENVLKNDSETAKQYDNSYFYLYNKNPEKYENVDRIGETYIKWGDYLKKVPEKKEKYKQGYNLYVDYFDKHKEEIKPISKLVYLAIELDDKVDEKINYVNNKGILTKLDHKTLAKIGLYYTEIERYKTVYDTISILNSQKTVEPLAYYMMGNYYYKAENLDLAEESLVKGYHFNGVYDKNEQRIKNSDNKLESKMDNMLGEIYLKLAQEYSGVKKSNIEKKDKFIKLATYHFERAQKNDPDNSLSYYYYGNMYYSYYNDYAKAIDYFENSYQKLKENQEKIPSDLYYNLSNALYNTGDIDKALEYLTELRTSSQFRVRPSIEFMMGMIYYKKGILEEAKEKFNNTIEYYKDDINQYIREPNPTSIKQNKILYINAIVENNLGCAYSEMARRYPESDFFDKSRTHFYKAMEYANRYNNKTMLALSTLNLKDTVLQDNIRYIDNFKVGYRSSFLYEFIPKYLGEYE